MRASRFLPAIAFAISAAAPVLASPGVALTTLNVRSGPGAFYPILDILRRGEPIEVRSCQYGWCYIANLSGVGWVSADYLDISGESDVRAVYPPATVIVLPPPRYSTWPIPWNEPIYPPRPGTPSPWPYPVPSYPEPYY